MRKIITLLLVCTFLAVIFTTPTFACSNCTCTGAVQESPWALCRDIGIICAGMVVSVYIVSKQTGFISMSFT